MGVLSFMDRRFFPGLVSLTGFFSKLIFSPFDIYVLVIQKVNIRLLSAQENWAQDTKEGLRKDSGSE